MDSLPLLTAFSRLDLAALIISRHPEATDAIFPHGPISKWNPRTAIPRDAVFARQPDQAQIEAAAMVHEVADGVVRVAVEMNLRGDEDGAAKMVGELIDDWCGTPWPGPRWDSTSINDARLVGAITFASFAARMGEGPLQKTFASGAQSLVEASVKQ